MLSSRAPFSGGGTMRIVVIGDIHRHPEHCREIPALATCDYLLAHGDLSNLGGRGAAAHVIAVLRQFCPRVLAQAGNLDRRGADEFLTEEGINLHGRARLLAKDADRLIVIGLGGANRTPLFTPREFSEKEMARFLDEGLRQACELELAAGAAMPTLLLTHAPPYGVVDRLRSGRHVGSKAVRAFIDEHQPTLCVCGHIHEAKGEDRLGATAIFNPGAFAKGGWVDIQVKAGSVLARLF